MGYQVLFPSKSLCSEKSVPLFSKLWISRTLIHTLPACWVCVSVCVCVFVCKCVSVASVTSHFANSPCCHVTLCAETQRRVLANTESHTSTSYSDARPRVFIWWVKSATVIHSASKIHYGDIKTDSSAWHRKLLEKSTGSYESRMSSHNYWC